MVIFSHRGIGFGKEENSLDALASAAKEGYSVEVDLRLKDGRIVLSHNQIKDIRDMQESSGLRELIKNRKIFFALHLKENSRVLFQKVSDLIKEHKNCFVFVTDFNQTDFIRYMHNIVGKEQLALYITTKDLNMDLVNKVDYFWLDETKEDIYKNLDFFMQFTKKIILCSPELFMRDYKERLAYLRNNLQRENRIFGICTDFKVLGQQE